jgi:hypothetical protein
MNPDYEHKLEREIDRELKALPELPVPAGFSDRVMMAVRARQRVPWYRQSWPAWPLPLRAATLVALLCGFGALCLAPGQLPAASTAPWSNVTGLFAGAYALLNSVTVVLDSLLLALKQLGAVWIVSCLVALAFGYAACVGLGTAFVRLAMVRR